MIEQASNLPGAGVPGEINRRELLLTKDGSYTVIVPSLDVTYRSRHGAVQESLHVFINAGLKYKWSNMALPGNHDLRIFELGYGTGLNALLTSQEALLSKQKVIYITIEAYPLEPALVSGLNYEDHGGHLQMMNEAEWNKWITVHPFFDFIKLQCSLAEFDPGKNIPPMPGATDNESKRQGSIIPMDVGHQGFVPTPGFDLVYFDAFGPLTQPQLWSGEAFSKIAAMMKSGAVLTTYCSKSIVRKTMTASGLHVTKVPGPYGKREMVRAFKP